MAAILLRGWSVDHVSGHCAHGDSGLQVYIDPSSTSSGALRCIGPFSAPDSRLREAQVRSLLADLTATLEKYPGHGDRYVLWGAFHSQAGYAEHVVQIMGQPAGMIPNPLLRTELAQLPNSALDLAREWQVDANSATHRSGLRFDLEPYDTAARIAALLGKPRRMHVGAPNGGADGSILHPALLEELIPSMAHQAFRLLCGDAVGTLFTRIDVVARDRLFIWHDREIARAS